MYAFTPLAPKHYLKSEQSVDKSSLRLFPTYRLSVRLVSITRFRDTHSHKVMMMMLMMMMAMLLCLNE